ncbi:MAG TPA: selenide, water dikinase SelD [Thermoanaerobaculia bacterium]|jgi:selenide,water dikinase|nr:selenide, water dikinase SelD [Thermoanaerobaculia bacterium]
MAGALEKFRLTGCATTGGCAAKVHPGELSDLLGPLLRSVSPGAEGTDDRVLVGAETSDDAGVFLFGDRALVATTDFIPPVCDDPFRFGRIAAANALSDVYAMGGRPLFALNLCCFPKKVPAEALSGILAGAADALAEAGAALLGGHSVRDPELKFGLAVIGEADPNRLLANTGALPGQRLILTKPLGTGVLVNAFRADKIGEADLDPVLDEMSRLNAEAGRLALLHGATAATDVTGFGLAGHAWNIARGSGATLRIRFERLPLHDGFLRLVEGGVTTGCTLPNEDHVRDHWEDRATLDLIQRAVLFDPQTSGGLLICVPGESAAALLEDLLAGGHKAAEVGEVIEGPAGIEVV